MRLVHEQDLRIKLNAAGSDQNSTLNGPVGFRESEAGITAQPELPSKLNACPTFPLANVALPSNAPLSALMMSLTLPFPGHHETIPAGAVTHAR
jgi:hypothetical protein